MIESEQAALEKECEERRVSEKQRLKDLSVKALTTKSTFMELTEQYFNVNENVHFSSQNDRRRGVRVSQNNYCTNVVPDRITREILQEMRDLAGTEVVHTSDNVIGDGQDPVKEQEVHLKDSERAVLQSAADAVGPPFKDVSLDGPKLTLDSFQPAKVVQVFEK